jgi:hypothetical protein
MLGSIFITDSAGAQQYGENVPRYENGPTGVPSERWIRWVPSGAVPASTPALVSHRFDVPETQKRQCPHDGRNVVMT